MEFLIKIKKQKRTLTVEFTTKSKNTLQELNVALDAYRKIGYEIVGAYKKVDTSNSDVKLN